MPTTRRHFLGTAAGTVAAAPLFAQERHRPRSPNEAIQIALIGALGPVSVAITSALGLDERFTAIQAIGGALVILGVLLVSVKRS